MRKRIVNTAFIFVIVAVLLSGAPSLYGKKAAAKVNLKGFTAFVEQQLKEWQVPGAAIAIVKDGKVIYARGFGFRNVEKKLPVTADTLFAIGSCTKAFTATILGILVDEKKLEWDKPVRDYLPDFKLEDSFASQQMTPVDLLTHRSGLPRHDLTWYGSSAAREELFKRLQYLEPSAGFRTTYQYNNLMFMTAGYMAGKIAGSTWEKLVQTKLFEPLGMKTSNLSVEDSKKSANFSLPYSKRDDKIAAVPFRNLDAIGPAGSINSSVNEMANWIILNLNKGKFGEKQIISERNLQIIQSPHMVTGRPLSKYKELFYNCYGMGWGISAYRGHPVISHGGGIDGFSAHVSFLPRDNAGVVILTNSDQGGGALYSVIRYNVYDRVLGLSRIPWAKRFMEEEEKDKAAAAKRKKKKDKNRKLDTKLSHKLEDYAGTFKNPGYGTLTITAAGEQLKASYNNLVYTGTHYHYDIFQFSSDVMGGHKRKFVFHTDEIGNIQKVSVRFQIGVKPIEFIRIPEKKK
jgi:CubicO group peptidase (beta-lactamase class C family)